MKKSVYIIFLMLAIISCNNETEQLFEKSADQRAADAIAKLKDDLTAPANGWKVLYQPEDESGAFWVLLDFNEDNTLSIRTDLGARDGEYFDDEITYRIDSSLGLELIMESYSFFSFLFEQDQATFQAEYEFLYQSKTPEGHLVFASKSDIGAPTVLVFQEAGPSDAALLGRVVSTNLNIISDDITGLVFASPSYRLSYTNRDLALFLSIDELKRTVSFNNASRKSTNAGAQSINFTTGFYLQGDSLILMSPLTGSFHGVNVNLKSIRFSTLAPATLNVCAGIPVNNYQGITSQNDAVALEPSLSSPRGATFPQVSDFYYSPNELIFNNGESAGQQIAADISGALAMQMYYNFNGEGFYAIGFVIVNPNGTTTFALRRFTPTLTGNRLVFNFEPTITLFGSQTTPANVNNINIYLNALTQGGQTYVFEVQQGVYEFYNPCTGWSAAFISN